jgi:SecD/SecF fusion protein
MSQNYAGRVTLIIVVLLLGLFGIPGLQDGIFSLQKVFDPSVPWAQKHNLKPGIDIAGGTSLLYEIKQPADGPRPEGDGTLAETVATLLKKRVDPNGTRNLIWRPQGDTRLEIQLPRTYANKEGTGQVRQDYAAAKEQLEKTNVSTAQVLAAVEQMSGDARKAQLNRLAAGNAQRDALYAQLASLYDQIKDLDAKLAAAKAAKQNTDDLAVQRATVRADYDAAKGRTDQTNVSTTELEAILDSAAADKAKQLDDFKARFPDRKALIDKYADLYPRFVAARGDISGAAELKRLLRGSGVLEFRILVQDPQSEQPDMIKRLEPGGDGPAPQAGDRSRWYVVDRPAELGRPTFTWRDKQYALAWTTPEKSMVHAEGGGDWGLQEAAVERDQNAQFRVRFSFDAPGGALFSRLTGNNIGSPLATILDARIITAPNIRSQIGDTGVIEMGSNSARTEAEARYVANTLSAGSLPAQLADEPISEREVGPQLGESNLRAGLFSCVAGLVIVAIFMSVYYHLAGVVAMIGLVINLVIIIGVLAMMGATFTLPGIAGLVLTIGVSVDANVLIFERLREEQMRGLSLKLALRNAYDRAFTAILDSNVTTAITSVCLIYFGSEEVRGFGLTLLIGILTSLFTALFVTRTVFGIMVDKYDLRHLGSLPLSYPRWNELMHPKIDWMGKVKYFLAVSTFFVILGLVALVQKHRQGQVFDVEFAAGTEVVFETKEPMADNEVRELVSKRPADLPAPQVVAVGEEVGKDRYKTFSIVTPNADRKQVNDAVFAVMGPYLNATVPSKFDRSASSFEDAAQAGLVVPVDVKNNRFVVGGRDIGEAAAPFQGGQAIVLNNIDPPLRPGQIADRMAAAVLGTPDADAFTRTTVVPLEGRVEDTQTPVKSAAVLVLNPKFDFARNPADAREKLAAPAWRAVTTGLLGQDAKLQKVSNFDPQVAGDTQRDAIYATLWSMVGIMVWIWLRFGDVKYGTATVMAMLHDTILVIGAIGLSHWLAGTAVGSLLGVEAFRVNMTIVAAVLTVMGYSMVDTIVVFDRIRENRGKYGTLSRQLINDSISQTLSRTLLTAGTTLVTLLVMYIWGGPAIHGFTFILFIGIIIGTYSSIAVAAPLLLIGVKPPAAGQKLPPAKTSAGAVTSPGAVAKEKVGA